MLGDQRILRSLLELAVEVFQDCAVLKLVVAALNDDSASYRQLSDFVWIN